MVLFHEFLRALGQDEEDIDKHCEEYQWWQHIEGPFSGVLMAEDQCTYGKEDGGRGEGC